MLAKFLGVTAAANAMWADEANHAKMLPVIAKDAGMDEEATAATLATFKFPTVDEQLSEAWLAVQRSPSWAAWPVSLWARARSQAHWTAMMAAVNTGPLEAAKGM